MLRQIQVCVATALAESAKAIHALAGRDANCRASNERNKRAFACSTSSWGASSCRPGSSTHASSNCSANENPHAKRMADMKLPRPDEWLEKLMPRHAVDRTIWPFSRIPLYVESRA